VLKTRIDQDALHQTSGVKLGKALEAKKECERARKALPDYLRGHLFPFQRRRIERHLKVCPVCTSEFHSLRFAADTRQLLKDITPSEGMAARLEAVLLFFGRLRLLLYHPLWLILTVLIAGYLYFLVIVPSRHDPELESIARSLPAVALSAPTTSRPAPIPSSPVAARTPAPPLAVKAPVPSVEPLSITITPVDQSSLRRINDIMKGHARTRKLRFTETVREVSGSLAPGELQTLFGRIEQAGKVSYSKKRFSALSATDLVPFLLKLKDAPLAPAKPAIVVPAEKPAPGAAVAPPQPAVSSPTLSAQP
jgi:hypothetical protein